MTRDMHLEVENLETGNYVVFAELEYMINMNQANFTLTCYGPAEAKIQRIK